MKRIIIYVLFTTFVIIVAAQTSVVEQDFETWSKVGAEAKLGDRWNLGIEEQFRLRQNSTTIDEYFTGVSLKYTLIDKKLKFATGYRFISENHFESIYELEQRVNFDLIYMQKLNKFKLITRLRYQNRNDVGESKADGDYPRKYFRLRLNAEYKIKNWKLDPIMSFELFRKYEKYTLPYFSDFRFRIGTKYNMKKYGEIEAFYQIDRELGIVYPQTTYVIGLGYSYNFGNILTKKD
jgi:hypothetical protein